MVRRISLEITETVKSQKMWTKKKYADCGEKPTEKKSLTELRDPPLLLWKVLDSIFFFVFLVRKACIRSALGHCEQGWICWSMLEKPRSAFSPSRCIFSPTVQHPSYEGGLVCFCFGIAISCCQGISLLPAQNRANNVHNCYAQRSDRTIPSIDTNYWGRLAAFTSGDCPMCFQELFVI